MTWRNHRLHIAALVLSLVWMSHARAGGIEDRLQSALMSAVCAHTGYAPRNVEIKQHRTRIAPKYQSADRVTVTLPAYDDGIGPVTARATFQRKGTVLGSTPVPIRVDIYDSVLITTRRLKRQDTIERDDVALEWLKITRLVKWTLDMPDSLAECRAARAINAGSIVDRRWVEKIPMVQQGDHVTLEYESGGVRVTANATAMEDGYKEQTIRVKTEYANRLLDAVVTGKGTVAPSY